MLSTSCPVEVERGWSIHTVDAKNAFESPILDQRCFGYQQCVASNGCTRFRDIQLSVAKQTCLNDPTCIAVSCEDQDGDGECSRGFLSDSCDSSSIDDEANWTIYSVTGKVKAIFVFTH